MTRCYAILLIGGVLAHDQVIDRPMTWAHRRSALRAMKRLWAACEVVELRYYTAEEDYAGNGLPSYVVA